MTGGWGKSALMVAQWLPMHPTSGVSSLALDGGACHETNQVRVASRLSPRRRPRFIPVIDRSFAISRLKSLDRPRGGALHAGSVRSLRFVGATAHLRSCT